MTTAVPYWPDLQVVINDDHTPFMIFKQGVHREGLLWSIADNWNTAVEVPDELPGWKLIHARLDADDGDGSRAYVLDQSGGTLLHLSHSTGRIYVTIAARSRQQANATMQLLREQFPETEPQPSKVAVTFWFLTGNGPSRVTRTLDVHKWSGICENYPNSTRQALTELMNEFVPADGGQLLLWQGVPGTGKTHGLRALASEWREWADFHYITDPDNLFGQHADYLIQVLLHNSSDEKWKVLVLEDTGELLSADAKQRTGQGLSRLLNTVDGLIGQGLKILVLVTTNEELKSLHPAVARPGRCASRVTFAEMNRAEGRTWLRANGAPDEIDCPGSVSLAELYAILGGKVDVTDRTVGFTK